MKLNHYLSLLLLSTPLISHSFTLQNPPFHPHSCSTTVSSSSSSSTRLHSSTWFIDGTNLQYQKSIPRSRTQIEENLLPCTHSGNIILVYDNGREDEMDGSITMLSPEKEEEEEGQNYFKKVITAANQSADDFILSEIQKLNAIEVEEVEKSSGGRRRRNGGRSNKPTVNLVTADKGLRRLVLKEEKKRVVDVIVVNPITFWKKYKSRLGGYKSTYENKPKEE
mmetsp:Transcript_32666/g.48674  ORF Transcript_32666/g.48674 Transcript_32666/m.48674 type:complete len:223 (-) Transcript_32666:476-1144(-)